MREPDDIIPWQSRLGLPLGSAFGLISEGLYQTQEEIDNAPTVAGANQALRLGDIKFKDVNGDGKVDNDDMVHIGRSNIPELVVGVNGGFNWKGVDFSFLLQGASLVDRMLAGAAWGNGAVDLTPMTRPFYAGWDNAPMYLLEGSWTPDHTDARYPRLSLQFNNQNGMMSDFWKFDGSYMRLKHVTLGYTLSADYLRALKLNSIRLYLTGTNLLTFSHFKYFDPEAPNVLQGYYPQSKQVSIGLEVNI